MSESNGHGVVAIPGQFNINIVGRPGPTAHPITVIVPQNGGVQVHAFGGLSKLQAAAAPILGSLLATTPLGEQPDVNLMGISIRAADALLKACDEYEEKRKQNNGAIEL